MKIGIPKFDGHAQGDAFLDLLYTIERIFYFKDYSKEKKSKVSGTQTKGICFPLVGKPKTGTSLRRKETDSNVGETQAQNEKEVYFRKL